MYSTEQNPNGCCDGYMWNSAVGNCVGMVSTLNILFIVINDYELF